MASHSFIFALISGSFHMMTSKWLIKMYNSFNSVYRRGSAIRGNGQVGDCGSAVEEEDSRINLTSEFIEEQEGAPGSIGSFTV